MLESKAIDRPTAVLGLGGRSYDVLGEIEGVAPMGHEEQADDRMKERARELHADLIINVEFHHWEGDAAIRSTGRAIRFRPSSLHLFAESDSLGPFPHATRRAVFATVELTS